MKMSLPKKKNDDLINDCLWKYTIKMIKRSYDSLEKSYALLDSVSLTYNWKRMETRNGYIVKLPLWGFEKSEVSVKANEGTVYVRAKSKGTDTLTWDLNSPKNANMNTLRADIRNGKLWLRVDRKTCCDSSKVKSETKKYCSKSTEVKKVIRWPFIK